MSKWTFLEPELEELKQEGRYRPLLEWEGATGVWMQLDGKRVLQLSSNNYLGLATHPRLKEAAIEAVKTHGVGSGSVRTITGTQDLHAQLEEELAAFKGTEAALLFQSGFTTNQGILSALLQPEDLVISDELNHASIIDGIRLTKATRKIYRHKDLQQLEEILQQAGDHRLKLIVTDGVFSMDGDIAPLPEIVELAERYGAVVYVDDAHASGVLGPNGKGSVAHFGLEGRVAIQVGTMSKAIGVVGGYVACDQILKDYLIHKARPFLFSASAAPAVVAACREAVRIFQEDDGRIARLWKNTEAFRKGLHDLGFDTGESETPIIPIIVGSPAETMAFSDRLLAEGVFAQGIVYPTVALDKGRVRMTLTSEHGEEEIAFALTAIEKAGRASGLI